MTTSLIDILKMIGAVALPLAVMDAVWLNVMSKAFYAKYIGSIMTNNPVWIAAILFYIIYIIGVVFFVVSPALTAHLPWYQVLLRGALFGLVAYATYDLTNQATLTNWSWMVTGVDLVWGAFLTGVSSVIAYMILK